MVEPQPSKLMMRVRFPLPAPKPLDKMSFDVPYQFLFKVMRKGDGSERITRSHSSVGRALPW